VKTYQKQTKSSGPINTVLYGSSIVTLAFWTKFGDPFNSVKLIFILAIAAWLMGHFLTNYRSLIKKTVFRYQYLIIFIFISSLFIATLNSEVQQVAWLGEYQRNNGFLFYLALSVILLATSSYFNWSDIGKLSNIVYLLALVSLSYGSLQFFGKDFVKWINPYNDIILTLGNPNFAGAFLAFIGVLSFGFGISYKGNKLRFTSYLIIFGLTLFLIIASGARQGLLAIIMGCSLIITVYIYSVSKLMGLLTILAFSALGVISILGMLQIGPLSQLLYKGSVTVRGFYWRAGVKMFSENPWFGVGVDNYGSYFKQYREMNYALNYGFDITSTNAHNVFIQMYAVGGLFVGTAYLLLCVYIFWRGLIGLRKKTFDKRISLSAIIGAWLALQSTSFVSIDSPGLAIWAWVMSGIILALTSGGEADELKPKKLPGDQQHKVNPTQTLLSAFLIIPVLVLSISIFRVENLIYEARRNSNPKSMESGKFLLSSIPNRAANPVINTVQITELGSLLASSGYGMEGIELLKIAITRNSRNLDALNLLASYYTELEKPELAVDLRLKIMDLDPHNAKNYYQLGLNYKSLGDYVNMEKMKNKVLSFAKDTPEGAAALKDLVP
jgi:O-antigen ligase